MAKTLTANVKERVALGQTKYDYIGTFTFGNEYTAGGSPITTTTGVVTSLPLNFDHCSIGSAGGWTAEYVGGATPVVKVYGAGTAKKVGEEPADKTDISAVAFTFRAVGS